MNKNGMTDVGSTTRTVDERLDSIKHTVRDVVDQGAQKADALKSRMMAFLQGYLSRAGAKPPHVQAMIRSVAESVEDGPKTRQELLAAARKKVGRAMRGWLDQSWSGVRPAVIDGAIVYGPPRGAEATYIATDAWLGPQPAWDVEDARLELLRRFLSAFGPATPHDFAKWSGLKTSDARQLIAKAGDELAIVSVDGAHGSILRRDLAPLSRCELDRDAVTLLGAFDSFLLAHATKEHLVDARFYTRVYRPQGWISPVVLRGGTVAGVWFPTRVKGEMRVDVELFVRSTPAVRRAVEQEVEAMSQFLAVRCQVRFKTSSRQA